MSNQESMWERFKLLAGFSGKDSQALAEVESDARTSGGVSTGSTEVLVLDVSISMLDDDYKPTRLDGAKTASCAFLRKLRDVSSETLAGVVSFGDKGKVVCRPIRVGDGLVHLESKVKGLKEDGCTNMTSGLNLAGELIRNCPGNSGGRIVMLTDGHANDGGDPVSVAQDLKRQGIQLDIIGIGGSPGDVNEKDLKKMASVVDGRRRYWFIRNVPDLVKRFEALAMREVD
jgi:Mg-chelatase subunit ChlD